MTVPYTFATQSNAIPLSQLDSNFATAITLGGTPLYLGNTTTSVSNLTLSNVTISSVGSTFPNSYLSNNTVILGSTTLTLGSTTTSVSSLTLNNSIINTRATLITNATSVTINADTTDFAYQINTQAVGTLTINAPTGTPVNGQKFIFRLQSTNIQTFSFNAIFTGSTDQSLPASSSGSSKYDYMGFVYNSTSSKWNMIAKNFGFIS
jgi:hypothetical protein